MIALMLDDPRVKTLGLPLDGATVRVETRIADASTARHEAAQPRHAQTTLPALFGLRSQRLDHGVNQYRLRHRQRVGVPRILLVAEHHHA